MQQGVPRPRLRKHIFRERYIAINICCFQKVVSQTSTMERFWALETATQLSYGRSKNQEFLFLRCYALWELPSVADGSYQQKPIFHRLDTCSPQNNPNRPFLKLWNSAISRYEWRHFDFSEIFFNHGVSSNAQHTVNFIGSRIA